MALNKEQRVTRSVPSEMFRTLLKTTNFRTIRQYQQYRTSREEYCHLQKKSHKMALSYVPRRFFNTAVKKWAYNLSGFNKLGLMRDDCLYENDDVKEALRRLPGHIKDERNYRILRAIQLNMTHSILPKEQWTKYEEDITYLQPYLKEVIQEREEKEAWDKNY